ncbi:hypothetical protein [Micromonospora sp. DPT]|uniref:hypothetical protein n=1 Tax=Micromonospora sp. DPT TaxID=3142975 RepID=UPI00320A9DB2
MNTFTVVTILTQDGAQITEHQMVGEPLAPGLAITPAVHTGGFTGGWTVTHTASGWSVTRSNVCLPCLRRAAQTLVNADVDWTRNRDTVIADPNAVMASEDFTDLARDCSGTDCVAGLIEAGF